MGFIAYCTILGTLKNPFWLVLFVWTFASPCNGSDFQVKDAFTGRLFHPFKWHAGCDFRCASRDMTRPLCFKGQLDLFFHCHTAHEIPFTETWSSSRWNVTGVSWKSTAHTSPGNEWGHSWRLHTWKTFNASFLSIMPSNPSMIWLCLPHDPLLGLWNQMSREKYPYPGYPIPLDWLVSTYTCYGSSSVVFFMEIEYWHCDCSRPQMAPRRYWCTEGPVHTWWS